MSGTEGKLNKGEESSSSIEGKRGREGDEPEYEIFKRSRRTTRSPLKSHKSEEKLDRVLNMLVEMRVEIAEIKKRQEEGNEEVGAISREMLELRKEQERYREELATVRRENETLKGQFEASRKENKEIRNELNNMRKSVDNYEKEKRENNIVISGLKMDTNGDREETRKKVDEIMGKCLEVRVNIKEVQKIGPKTCLVKLADMRDKDEVMKNKQKLRNLREEKIYIDHDLTLKERDMQKQIRMRARTEREAGKAVKVGFSKITIEGVVWRWNKEVCMLEIAKN